MHDLGQGEFEFTGAVITEEAFEFAHRTSPSIKEIACRAAAALDSQTEAPASLSRRA